MIQIVWQYEVKEAFRARFELAYGPGGAWSQLFGGSPGYRGTVLLHDAHHPHRYLSVTAGTSADEHQAFLEEHRDEYSSLGSTFKEWTNSRPRSVSTSSLPRQRCDLAQAGAEPAPDQRVEQEAPDLENLQGA